jgi:hypothetical protein
MVESHQECCASEIVGASVILRPSVRGGALKARPKALTVKKAQAGAGIIALLFWATLICSVALLGMQIAPTVIEYSSIKRAVDKLASGGAQSPQEIRAAFEKQRQIDYGITAVTGNDLVITKRKDGFEIAFAYDKEIPLFGPAVLVLKYDGSSMTR